MHDKRAARRKRPAGSGKLRSRMSIRKPFDSYFRMLCHTEQREAWERAAELLGEDTSAYLRRLADADAERVIAEHAAKKRRKS